MFVGQLDQRQQQKVKLKSSSALGRDVLGVASSDTQDSSNCSKSCTIYFQDHGFSHSIFRTFLPV